MLGHGEVRRDLVELHLLDAGRLVLAGADDVVLDRVVDLVVGDHGRRHADRREGRAPDRRALHADLQALDLLEAAHLGVREDVARAAAGIADQQHARALLELIGDRLEEVGLQDRVPVVEVAEQERRVDERRRLREGRHVRRRDDGVVDRGALGHVLEILLLEAELAVQVHDELDRPVVVFLHQLLEPGHGPREGVLLVELRGAVQRDRLLGMGAAGRERHAESGDSRPGDDFVQSHLVLSLVSGFAPAAAGHSALAPRRSTFSAAIGLPAAPP